MQCFLIARGEVIGQMEPNRFDEWMGVVTGDFHPNANYSVIQSIVREKYSGQVTSLTQELELRAQTEDGEQLEPSVGLRLFDLSLELEEDALELEEDSLELDVVGLPQEQFLRFWRDAHSDEA